MRLAVFADIHGNSVALDAVLRDIEDAGGVDAYWVLGDHVAIGHDPVGVLDRLSSLRNASFVRGNTDRYTVVRDRPFPSIDDVANRPESVPTIVEAEGTFSWAHGAVVAAGRYEWLASLPLETRIEAEDGTRVLGVHASPGRDDGPGAARGRTDDELRALFGGCDADIVFVGHTHQTFDRTVDGVRIVNPGSVSNHLDADTTAKWALLASSRDGCEVTLHSVGYDTDAVVAELERVRHPGAAYIARMLRGEATGPSHPSA